MSRAPWSLDRAEEHLLSLELFGMRFGLERMRRLLLALDSPQTAFRAVHVVGTNGKSSTTRFVAALARAHGVRAGAYLSPHLTSFAERVLVNGHDVSGDAFAAAVQRTAEAAIKVGRSEPEPVTQFELLTAAAFVALADAGVEVAAVEAGLGGRWDATNVLDAPVVVLTNVGLEHTRWLGPTITDIAREKLAVVRPAATLVTGPLAPEARAVAADTGAARWVEVPTPALDLPLAPFQQTNAAVAGAAVEALLGPLDAAAARAAVLATEVRGRFERVGEAPLTVVDGAHNPAGMAALVDALDALDTTGRLVACVSVLDDKDAAAMLAPLLARCAAAVFCSAPNPRALPPATLASLAGQVGPAGLATELVRDPQAALERARALAGPDGAVVATGSIYLVADLLSPAGTRKASAL